MTSLLNLIFLFSTFSYANWEVSADWHVDAKTGYNSIAYKASVSGISCEDGKSLFFPNLMHSMHEIYLDGKLIERFGNKNTGYVRSIYGAPVLDCVRIKDGKSIEWLVYSPIKYFAKVRNTPVVDSSTDLLRNSDLKSLTIYGALFVFAIMLFLGPKTTRLRKQAIYLASFSIWMSVFFLVSVAGYFGFKINFLIIDKFAVISLGIAVFCFNNFLFQRDLINKKLLRIFSFMSVAGTLAIPFLSSGDDIQMVLNVIFGPALCGVWIAIANDLRENYKFSSFKNPEFIALASFAISATADIFYTLGLHNHGMSLGYGVLGAIFFFSKSLQNDIVKAYEERDYLRLNLEQEVETKTLSLNNAMIELKSTQAELVQNAKLASLGTLSAGIAHEINNNINYVNACLVGLEREIKKASLENQEKVNKLLSTIKHGTTMTIDIVNSLRNYTGLNQAKMRQVDFREVVKSVRTIINRKIDRIKFDEHYVGDTNLICNVVGLNQMMMNLISNAVDAVDKQSGHIFVSAVEDGANIVVKIKDNGSGIPAEVADKVFDPFFTTKDVGSGTGLGLFIVKKEVDSHNGKISLISKVHAGTEFTIVLPKVNANEEAA